MRDTDELKTLVEDYLEELELWPELHGQARSMRYALVEMGGKRIRPVICLATGEAVGAAPEQILPAAAALELVHNFSLVHDDLPALDDDAERRGKPSDAAAYGEGKAAPAGSRTRRPNARATRSRASTPTRRCSPGSSTTSPFARLERRPERLVRRLLRGGVARRDRAEHPRGTDARGGGLRARAARARA